MLIPPSTLPLRLLQFLLRYGYKYVLWAVRNASTVWRWINSGAAYTTILARIRAVIG